MQPNEKINLSGLRRCDQIWEKMTPAEQGRICQKCQQTIIDFRHYSSLEIARKHAFTAGRVCGLYTKEQLTPPAPVKSQKRKKGRAFYFSLMSLFFTKSLSAQVVVDTIQTEPDYQAKRDSTPVENSHPKKLSDSLFISGLLTGSLNEPLIGATILIQEYIAGTVTDFDGRFRLDIPESLKDSNQITLIFSYTGFESQQMIISIDELKVNSQEELRIVLDQVTLLNFSVSLRFPLHKRIWFRIKRFFTWRK